MSQNPAKIFYSYPILDSINRVPVCTDAISNKDRQYRVSKNVKLPIACSMSSLNKVTTWQNFLLHHLRSSQWNGDQVEKYVPCFLPSILSFRIALLLWNKSYALNVHFAMLPIHFCFFGGTNQSTSDHARTSSDTF